MSALSTLARSTISTLARSVDAVPNLSGASGNGTGIDIQPAQSGNLPGDAVLTNLASGVGHWALLASVVGVIVGGVMWAFGHYSHNYQQSYNGRRGVVVSGVAALLIGASPAIIGFFFAQGGKVH
jgi:type IV secretory pathway VirB2 component (pilin)